MRALGALARPSQAGLLLSGTPHLPPTAPTAAQNLFASRKYGWQINLNQNQQGGGYFPDVVPDRPGTLTTRMLGEAPSAEAYKQLTNNVPNWATVAVAKGADYLDGTWFNEWGFPLWPTKVKLPPQASSGLGAGYPKWPNGPVAGLADCNLLAKVDAEFQQKRGLPTRCYLNTDWSYNLWPGFLQVTQSDANWAYIDRVIDYHCQLIQELYYVYNVRWFWLDSGAWNGNGRAQRYYDCIRSLGADALCVANDGGDEASAFWPFDATSCEGYAYVNGKTTYQNRSYQKNGATYYAVRELIATPRRLFEDYYLTENTPNPRTPGHETLYTPANYERMKFDNEAVFQDMVANARAYKCPFCVAMPITQAGELHDLTLNFLDQIDFS